MIRRTDVCVLAGVAVAVPLAIGAGGLVVDHRGERCARVRAVSAQRGRAGQPAVRPRRDKIGREAGKRRRDLL